MRRILTIVCLALFGACASSSKPVDKMASSEASIRAAEEAGAKNVPTAALHLQYALEQAEQAKQLMSNNENERAKWVLMRAEADAELALALAHGEGMRQDVQKAIDQVHKLQGGGTP